MTSRAINLQPLAQSLWNAFSVMADTFYATFELKNSRMEGLFFIFLGGYRYNAIFCDRIWPKLTHEFSSFKSTSGAPNEKILLQASECRFYVVTFLCYLKAYFKR